MSTGSYVRTFRLAAFLDGLARALPPGLYAVAAAALAAKIAGHWSGRPPEAAPAVLAAAGLSVLLGALVAARRAPCDENFVRAWLDWRNHAGGRILAGHAPVEWPALSVKPSLSLKPVLKAALWPLAFGAVVFFVPERTAPRPKAGRGVERKIAVVEHAIDSAVLRHALPAQTAAELRERLQAVEQAAAAAPEGAAEAADAVRAQLEDAILARVGSAMTALEKATRAQEALGAAAEDPAAARSSLQALADALDGIAKADGGAARLPEDIAKALGDLMANADAATLADLAPWASAGDLARLDPGDLRRLAEALREAAAGRGERAGQCPLGAGAAEALAAMMAGMPSLSGQTPNMDGLTDMPGSGGVGRGAADAPLSFGGESDASGARFEPRALPPGEKFVPGAQLGVDRLAMPAGMPPEEFRAPRRTGVSVDGPVRAGESAPALGPDRAEAAARYFTRLSGK